MGVSYFKGIYLSMREFGPLPAYASFVSGCFWSPQQSKDFLQFEACCGAFRSCFVRGTGTGQLCMLHTKCVAEAAALTRCISSFFFLSFFFHFFFLERPQSRLQINNLFLFSLIYKCALSPAPVQPGFAEPYLQCWVFASYLE